jgi:periplasmic divalent cation tolerance protein
LITASDEAEGNKVAGALLEARLAACVNMVPGVSSRYWWQGALESAQEALLIVKTRRSLLEQVVATVKASHSYTVPEIIALPILGGNPDYLAWLRTETGGGQP